MMRGERQKMAVGDLPGGFHPWREIACSPVVGEPDDLALFGRLEPGKGGDPVGNRDPELGCLMDDPDEPQFGDRASGKEVACRQ